MNTYAVNDIGKYSVNSYYGKNKPFYKIIHKLNPSFSGRTRYSKVPVPYGHSKSYFQVLAKSASCPQGLDKALLGD
uniref:KTSC domain-containing protein n=1 Tax=Heterorhabditis bacteriophora TaxID=37862 RepID=A0A1I7WHJ1_HETBA